jgi:hypothetical protein
MKMINHSLKIGIVGDIMAADSPLMAGRGVYSACRGEFGPVFASLAEHAKGCDFFVGNFEGILVDKISGRSPAAMSMRMPLSLLPTLRQCKFRYLSIANNHTMDAGPVAFRWMCDRLAQAEMVPFGHREHPYVVFRDPVSGVRVGLLAFSTVPVRREVPPEYYFLDPRSPGNVNRCIDWVRQAKGDCDQLLVFPHWGSEFMPRPSAWQCDLAQQLIRNGSDAIFGAHPHRLQTASSIKGRPVCFSLGNLVSDYFQERLRRSLVVTVDLGMTELSVTGRIFSYDDRYVLSATEEHVAEFTDPLESESEQDYIGQQLRERNIVRREMLHHLFSHPGRWLGNWGLWGWLIGRAFFIVKRYRRLRRNPDAIYS